MINESTAVKGLKYNKQVGWRENVICNEKDEFVQCDTVSLNSIKLCFANNDVKIMALHHSASFTFRQRSGHSFVLFPKRVGNQRIPSSSCCCQSAQSSHVNSRRRRRPVIPGHYAAPTLQVAVLVIVFPFPGEISQNRLLPDAARNYPSPCIWSETWKGGRNGRCRTYCLVAMFLKRGGKIKCFIKREERLVR